MPLMAFGEAVRSSECACPKSACHRFNASPIGMAVSSVLAKPDGRISGPHGVIDPIQAQIG